MPMSIKSNLFLALFCTSFKVSDLVLGSLIYFELVFVQGERHGYSFSFLHADTQFSQQHLLKRLSFLCHMFLMPLWKIMQAWFHGFIPESSVLFCWSSYLFLCSALLFLLLSP
jgi:hypothetical protein